MRACKAVLALSIMALSMGVVQASSRQSSLRISMTIVDRCDIRSGSANPSVDCSAGVPWMVATPAAARGPSLVTSAANPAHLPVPRSGVADGTRVTTIVF